MTAVYLTIDTEYTAHLPGAGGGPGERALNFARSITCDTPAGSVGTGYQMDVLDRHELKAVFFVDPMPALDWGVSAIADVVEPILTRGHDVQLHCHTEWLDFVTGSSIVDGRTGRNLKDFSTDDQFEILRFARDTLIAAGAPAPMAFRAGNYGANDDTLRVLAELGIGYDSSHVPALITAHSDCSIALGQADRQPKEHCGVVEVPVGCIGTHGGRLRHGQLTALSRRELLAAIRYAQFCGHESFTLVSHSFELLSRDRLRKNKLLVRRFERFCASISAMQGVRTETYANPPPVVSAGSHLDPALSHHLVRGSLRVIEQVCGNIIYNRRLRPGH